MPEIIPLTRFRAFIAEAVTAAYNAKTDLMRARSANGELPIVTGDFVLNITGILVDNLGGKGINEIEVISKVLTPSLTESSEVTTPEEVTKTVISPETSTTSATDSVADDTYSDEATASNETATESVTEASSNQGQETQQEQNDQVYGRFVTTQTSED